MRWLPGVDEILNTESIKQYNAIPRALIVDTVRTVLAEFRKDLQQHQDAFSSSWELKNAIFKEIKKRLEKHSRPMLRPVINATGVVLHTNLGRAVLSNEARDAVCTIISGYSNLELNLETGLRGSRYSHVEDLLIRLTGAEAALVVNNNAAAVLLALDTLARGKSTIVSRGELVEIGGAFRIPEVMERSGSKLVEVGTTNKTYGGDYERAVTEETGLLLKVHTSNYRIVGFSQEVDIKELALLGSKYGIPVMYDLGSGCLFDLKSAGVRDEPTVSQVVAGGADVVTFSGDKLLGGPQAGIIVGRGKYISLMKRNPLNRALRVGKMTIATLEATLKSYLDQERAFREIPTSEMLTRPLEKLEHQAQTIQNYLLEELKGCLEVKIEPGVSQVGGGSLPTCELPTWLVLIKQNKESADALASSLRKGSPSVLAYIRENWVVMDPRTIFPDQYADLIQAFKQACGGK